MRRAHLAFDRFFQIVEETADAQAAQMTLGADESTGGPTNYHEAADQWLFVHSGSGWAVVDDERYRLEEGDLVCIEAGERHEVGADADTAMETLNLYVPPRG